MSPFVRWTAMAALFAAGSSTASFAAADEEERPRQQAQADVHEGPEPGMRPAARPLYPPPAPRAPQAETVTEEKMGPNRGLLFGGIALFGVSYGAAAVAAASSDLDANQRMWVPVAGPWMALADRPSCETCSEEYLDRVLIVTDGVVQGIGALLVVGSFLNPEKRSVTRVGSARAPRLRISAITGRDRLGLAAVGTF